MQPKVLELRILNQFSRILLEEDDDHTNDVVVVVVVDGDDDDDNDVDNDDNDPVKLFQKRGKWWELIVWLQYQMIINE